MYSMVMMMAMTTGGEMPEFGRRNSCNGGCISYSCNGGCNGGGLFGGGLFGGCKGG